MFARLRLVTFLALFCSASYGGGLIAIPSERLAVSIRQNADSLIEIEKKLLAKDGEVAEVELIDLAVKENELLYWSPSKLLDPRADCRRTWDTAVYGVPSKKNSAYYFDLILKGFGFGDGLRLVEAVDQYGTKFIQSSGFFGELDDLVALDLVFDDIADRDFITRVNVSSLSGPYKMVYEASRPNGRLIDTQNGLRVLLDHGESFLNDRIVEIVLVQDGDGGRIENPYNSFLVNPIPSCQIIYNSTSKFDPQQLVGFRSGEGYRVKVPVGLDFDDFLSGYIYLCPKNGLPCALVDEAGGMVGDVVLRVEKFFPLYTFMPVDDFGNSHHSYSFFFKRIVSSNRVNTHRQYIPASTDFFECDREQADPIDQFVSPSEYVFRLGVIKRSSDKGSLTPGEVGRSLVCGETKFREVVPGYKTVRVKAVNYSSSSIDISKERIKGEENSPRIKKVCAQIRESKLPNTQVFWSNYIEGPFCSVCNGLRKYEVYSKKRLQFTFMDRGNVPISLTDADEVCFETELGFKQQAYVVPVRFVPSLDENFFVSKHTNDADLVSKAIPANNYYFESEDATYLFSNSISRIDSIFPNLDSMLVKPTKSIVRYSGSMIVLVVISGILAWLVKPPLFAFVLWTPIFILALSAGQESVYLSFWTGVLVMWLYILQSPFDSNMSRIVIVLCVLAAAYLLADLVAAIAGCLLVVWIRITGAIIKRFYDWV